MKNILIIIAFLFVLPMVGQKTKATLHFKDGTKLTGLAKITTYGDKIKFRKDKKSKRTVYTSKAIESIEIYEKKMLIYSIGMET